MGRRTYVHPACGVGCGLVSGDICWYTFKSPDKKRPVLILTRDSAIAILHSITVAPITSTIRGIPTEVVLTEADGLPNTCAANFQTVPKSNIGGHIARLTSAKMQEAGMAVSFALGFDGE
jgi:mRNA interferase MazF